MEGPSIACITREGSTIYVSTRMIDFSNFIKEKVEDLLCEEIPLDVSSHIMIKVKSFYEHHEYKDIKPVKKPIKTSNFTTIASEWDNNFFKTLTEEDMSELILAASYLQCDALLDYCSAFMASQFKDLTFDELRRKYDITDDLTPEIEEQMKKEYGFIFRDLSSDQQVPPQ